MFLRRKGPAWAFLKLLRKSKTCRGVRFQTRATGTQPDRVIIGIGQLHPVLRGRFTRGHARKIAKVQASIFSVCRYLHIKAGVRSFGQEGFSVIPGRPAEGRVDPEIIQTLMKDVYGRKGSGKVLLKVSKQWRKALKKKDQAEIIRTTTCLNALTLLQAVEEKVTVFPIERRDIHSAQGDEMNALHDAMDAIVKSKEYQSVKKKGGKGLTKEEYEAVRQHNDLTKKFEALLKSPKRDAAILENVLAFSEGKHITAFVLGKGHRKAMLQLAKTLPADVLFVWMTVKPLRGGRAKIIRYAGVLFALIVLLLLLNEVA